jgi:hypothetical protein
MSGNARRHIRREPNGPLYGNVPSLICVVFRRIPILRLPGPVDPNSNVEPFRFFFFSREEERLHIHVQSPGGEAKFWIEPNIELARNHQLSAQDLSRVLQLVVDHEQEIRDAWHHHFER